MAPTNPVQKQCGSSTNTSNSDASSSNAAEGAKTKASELTVEEYLLDKPLREEPLRWWRWHIAMIMQSQQFNMVLGLALLANAGLIGLSLDAGDAIGDVPQYIFLVFFCLELGFRVFGLGWLFFTDWSNTFDFVIVLSGVFGVMFQSVIDGGSGITILRMLRLARIARLFTTFKDLTLILQSFMKAVSGVFWVLVMLMLFVYMFSVCARIFIGMDETLQVDFPEVQDLFGSLTKSIITMTQLITLDSWTSQIARPIAEHKPWAYIFFLCYTLFSAFGVLNLLTAVFVNALLEATEARKMGVEKNRRAQKLKRLTQIEDMFALVDVDSGGTLGMGEMQEAMAVFEDPQWAPIFADLEMSPKTFAKLLFFLCSQGDIQASHKGQQEGQQEGQQVNYKEFLTQFAEMEEQVLRTESWMQQAVLSELKGQVNSLRTDMHAKFDATASMLGSLCTATGGDVSQLPRMPWEKGPPLANG